MNENHAFQPDPLDEAQACIVWHPRNSDPAPDLLRALTNKGMTLIDADDPHLAFAAALRAGRSAKRTVLVLEQRESLHSVDSICETIERFTPGVLCWAHVPGANPPLIPLVQPKKREKPDPASLSASPARPQSPLRLVGKGEQETEPTPSPEPLEGIASRAKQPLSARDVLDADELDALLAGEMGDRVK